MDDSILHEVPSQSALGMVNHQQSKFGEETKHMTMARHYISECAECRSDNLRRQGRCVTCYSCGWSLCG
jgi:hypothetical protein